MDTAEYSPLYQQGIEYFNECEFFEAHEVWEDLWSEDHSESRTFYQGLIQAAVALHHFGNGNIRGARKLYHSSSRYLEPFRPSYMGLDLDRFLGEFARCLAEVLASDEEYPEIAISAELIPEIHLDPSSEDASEDEH